MNNNRRIVLAIAAAGAAYCVYLLVGFVGVIADNRLPWAGTAQYTRDHYLAVGEAYSRWGKGVHAAGLNFGDCFAYEVARRNGCPLLFVGHDFTLTDIESVL